jgi:UDPglucose 6-dehydrogenase
MEEAKRIFGDNPNITYAKSNYEALENSDALLLVTEWNQFRRPDFNKIKTLLKEPVIFDGRNQYDPAELKNRGFTYYSIGR